MNIQKSELRYCAPIEDAKNYECNPWDWDNNVNELWDSVRHRKSECEKEEGGEHLAQDYPSGLQRNSHLRRSNTIHVYIVV